MRRYQPTMAPAPGGGSNQLLAQILGSIGRHRGPVVPAQGVADAGKQITAALLQKRQEDKAKADQASIAGTQQRALAAMLGGVKEFRNPDSDSNRAAHGLAPLTGEGLSKEEILIPGQSKGLGAAAQVLGGNPLTSEQGLALALKQAETDTANRQFFDRRTLDEEAKAALAKLKADLALRNSIEVQKAKPQLGTAQEQNYKFAVRNGYTGSFTDFIADTRKTIEKAPPGFHTKPDGTLEPIKGGPAAAKAEDRAKQKQEAIIGTQKMIRTLDELIAHPGRERATGFSSLFNKLPGTAGKDFSATLESLKAQAFLPMVQQLKGMGQLSNAEGQKLTDAIGALDPAMSEGAFLASLNQIKGDFNAALLRMQGRDKPNEARLPEGVSNDDIEATMKANGMTRQQVIEELERRQNAR